MKIFFAILIKNKVDIRANIATISSLVAEAKQQGAMFALFPENCIFIGQRQGQKKDITELLSACPPAESVQRAFAKIDLAIYFDLRFPEHSRALIDLCAELFIVPAAFACNTGKAQWLILLSARAIENHCYIVASGQVGSHGSCRDVVRHSMRMLVDSWGEVLAMQANGEGAISATVELIALTHQRNVFPDLTHRLV